MRFNANIYFIAAQEHVNAALELHDAGHYALSHYVAGLSVECLLRAYRYRLDTTFDERHDLRELFKASRFYEAIPENLQQETLAALNEVTTRWRNDHRFRSEAALRSTLKQAGLDRGIRGNFVKESSRRIVDAAFVLVNVGVSQWKHSSKG